MTPIVTQDPYQYDPEKAEDKLQRDLANLRAAAVLLEGAGFARREAADAQHARRGPQTDESEGTQHEPNS